MGKISDIWHLATSHYNVNDPDELVLREYYADYLESLRNNPCSNRLPGILCLIALVFIVATFIPKEQFGYVYSAIFLLILTNVYIDVVGVYVQCGKDDGIEEGLYFFKIFLLSLFILTLSFVLVPLYWMMKSICPPRIKLFYFLCFMGLIPLYFLIF